MARPITVIDLFAGPGGLGEGFSSYVNSKGAHPFKIALSIEKEASAHSTLTLRAFYRQFREAPPEYYTFLAGTRGRRPEEWLYNLPKFQTEADHAREEAQQLTLGEDTRKIDRLVDERAEDDNCILIGGPPCQAYSVVGRARRNGIAGYSPETDKRNFLYQEYLRVLRKTRPLVFVMENVKGMLSAQVNGERVFQRILEDLSDPWAADSLRAGKERYRVFSLVVPETEYGNDDLDPHDFVIRMENFGIPQARHRVILLGVREDIARKSTPSTLRPSPEVPVQEVIGDLPPLRSGISARSAGAARRDWLEALRDVKVVLAQVRAATLYGGNAVARVMEESIRAAEDIPDTRGRNFFEEPPKYSPHRHMRRSLKDWYQDPRQPHLVCNHESRGHMPEDLHRYLFCASWAKAAGIMKRDFDRQLPKPENFPSSLQPKHLNFKSGDFADRFRVQLPLKYGTTVTSHISKDGHYFIHYDPAQCRSLTVREAARIQTFPDNYFFLGSRTEQYVQVGNAVPPLLASRIADIVYNVIFPNKKMAS